MLFLRYLEKNIFCFGQVFGQEKYELLAKSKVFLFTSHFESFGIVVIENMMIKNLVIGYQIPSSLANFADRMIFIKNFDIDDFADKAHSLAQNFGNYDELLESNRQFAKGFSWEASYNNYLKLI